MRLPFFSKSFKGITQLFKGDILKARTDFLSLATHRIENLIIRFVLRQQHQVVSTPPFVETFAMPDELVSIDTGSHFGFDNNVNRLLKYGTIGNRSCGPY